MLTGKRDVKHLPGAMRRVKDDPSSRRIGRSAAAAVEQDRDSQNHLDGIVLLVMEEK